MSKLCAICGTEIPEGEEFVADEQVLCHEHFTELYAECHECGSIHAKADMILTADGDWVCDDCIEGNYALCDDCGEYVRVEYMYHVNPGCRDERYVCDSCIDSYGRCDHCDDYFSYNHIWNSDGDSTICYDCSDYYCVCDDCGAIVHVDDAHSDDDGNVYCDNCWVDEEAPIVRGIREYGYKPAPLFGTTDDRDGYDSYDGEELTFGVELECDKGKDPHGTAREICDLTDRVYCKHDGSLEYGYEVVTHPGTLAWHLNSFPWKDIVRISRANGFTSHDARTCGLHIHIGRDQMGGNSTEKLHTIANMILLTNVLWPEIGRFSRRNGDMHWCHMNDVMRELRAGMDDDTASLAVYNASREQGRYLAVNVQNRGTVELRFNRGTLNLETIYACLQLASNLTLFAKEHTMNECLEAKWDDVVNYNLYEELASYVNRRFAGWTPEGSRPSTTFRVGLIPESEKYRSDPDMAAGLVSDGAVLAPENTMAQLGDLVVLTHEYQGRSPRVGSIGVCISSGDSYCDAGFVWSDPEHTHHRHISSCFPDRQWYVPVDCYRVITAFRNGEAPNRELNLSVLGEFGLMPGDRVYSQDAPEKIGTLLFSEAYFGDLPVSTVRFDDFTFGHNGNGMTEDYSCWNHYSRSLRRVN